MDALRLSELSPDHPAWPLAAPLALLARHDVTTPPGLAPGPLIAALRSMAPAGARTAGASPILAPFTRLETLRDAAATAALVAGAPAATLARLRAGEGLVVFDCANEGRVFRPEQARAMHEALAAAGISPGRAAWLQQNRVLGDAYRAFCTGQGLAPMHAITAHSHAFALWRRLFAAELHPRQPEPPALWPFGFALAAEAPRRHRWICLNYAVRPHRAALAAWLLGRPEPGHLSFAMRRLKQDEEGGLDRLAEDARWLARVEPGLEAALARLLAEGLDRPGETDAFGHPSWRVHSLPVAEVAAAELFIVTETEMAWPALHRWTEKTLKALATGLPFVVFGNHGTIAGLAELGFDLLGDMVDHGYDAEPAPDRRFAAALRSVARFLARPPGFTPAEAARLRLAAEHNREVFARQVLRAAALDPLTAILAAARAA